MVMEGFKQTEVGWIPEDWEVKVIGEIITEISMGPFGSDIKVSNFVSKGVPVLNGYNISGVTLKNRHTNFVTKEKAKSLKKAVAKRGDIVVTHRGTIGQISYIPFNSEFEEYVISQSQFRFSLNKKKALYDFVVFFFHSDKGQSIISETKGHTGVPAIAQATTTFKKIAIPLPPLSEQKKIAKALSDNDLWIDSLEQLIAKKRLIKQGAMQELLTPKEGWEVKRLGDLFEILADYTANGSFESLKNNVKYYSERNYAVLVRTTDLEKKQFVPERFTDKNGYDFLGKTSLFGGELILANVGSIGKVFKIPKYNMPMTLAPNTYMIKMFSNYSQDYVHQWMKTKEFVNKLLSKVGSSTLMAINKDNLREIIINIPSSIAEQTRIASILSDMDAELESLEAQLAKARQVKQGMMQALLTGRIRLV